VKTALSIVATAQIDLSSCAAAHSRILEGTLLITQCKKGHKRESPWPPWKRPCQTKLFTLQNILEKSWMYAKDVYACFVDLQNTYDRVPPRNASESVVGLWCWQSPVTDCQVIVSLGCPWDIFTCPVPPHSNLCLSHPMGFPLPYYNINMEYNSIKTIKFMKV